jgi:hypothetical protein
VAQTYIDPKKYGRQENDDVACNSTYTKFLEELADGLIDFAMTQSKEVPLHGATPCSCPKCSSKVMKQDRLLHLACLNKAIAMKNAEKAERIAQAAKNKCEKLEQREAAVEKHSQAKEKKRKRKRKSGENMLRKRRGIKWLQPKWQKQSLQQEKPSSVLIIPVPTAKSIIQELTGMGVIFVRHLCALHVLVHQLEELLLNSSRTRSGNVPFAFPILCHPRNVADMSEYAEEVKVSLYG